MSIIQWLTNLLGSTSDPVLQIIGGSTALIIVSSFFTALWSAVFSIFTGRR